MTKRNKHVSEKINAHNNNNNNNNNIVICKAHKVSSNAESEAPKTNYKTICIVNYPHSSLLKANLLLRNYRELSKYQTIKYELNVYFSETNDICELQVNI